MTVSQQRLREVLTYDPETGIFTSLNKRPQFRGKTLGWKSEGYTLIKVDGRPYRAARLAWIFMTGAEPTLVVDHINGQRSDDRWVNLRQLTIAQNCQNRRVGHAGSSSRFLGVAADRGLWRADIMVNGIAHRLGRFKTEEAAHAAYLTAKRKLHSSCAI